MHKEKARSRSDITEDVGRDRLQTVLTGLLDYMECAEEVASGIAQKYPEYEAMAEAVRSATEMV